MSKVQGRDGQGPECITSGGVRGRTNRSSHRAGRRDGMNVANDKRSDRTSWHIRRASRSHVSGAWPLRMMNGGEKLALKDRTCELDLADEDDYSKRRWNV